MTYIGAKAGQTENCIWTEDEIEFGEWWTTCDKAFYFIDGGPKDNGMKYCCYCGKRLVEAPHEESEDK